MRRIIALGMLFCMLICGCGQQNSESGNAKVFKMEEEWRGLQTHIKEQMCELFYTKLEKREDFLVEKAEEYAKIKEKEEFLANFQLNHYALPQVYLDVIPQDVIKDYYRIVDAFLNFETSAPLENTHPQGHLLIQTLLMEYCPLFFTNNITEDGQVLMGRNRATGCFEWTYIDPNKENHEQRIEEFRLTVAEHMYRIKDMISLESKIIFLYRFYAIELTYDWEMFENENGLLRNPLTDGAYNAIINHTGVCTSFAQGYDYLLLQLGVDAVMINGNGESEEYGPHAWSMFQYDGNWYFADPTQDAHDGGLWYFGMTVDQREMYHYPREGYWNKILNEYLDEGIAEVFDVTDTHFVNMQHGATGNI